MRAFIVLLLVAAVSAKAPLLESKEPISGKYIVKIKEGSNLDEAVSRVRLSGGIIGHIFRRVLLGFAAELSDNVLDLVRNLDAVEYVEQDGVYRASCNKHSTWGLDRVDQRGASLNNRYTPRNTGSTYTVWVLDTGVRDSHSDFGGRAAQVMNFAGGQDDDCNGHGTHCAGSVGSNTYGVATGVNIKGIKVLNCLGAGSTSNIVAGCDYVVANKVGKDIASMSLGGGASVSMDNAVNNMVNNGIPTAVAAGNENQNACNVSPARASQAFTVAATDLLTSCSDIRASYSNYGSCVNIFAPGTDITSTWHTGDSATRTISGTSMACPHVAGGIAIFGGSTSSLNAAASINYISDVKGSPNRLLYVG